MVDTAESVKWIESIIVPIINLRNIHRLQFSIKDSIEWAIRSNPAKRQIFVVIDTGRRMMLDQGQS
jgi:hypothetical protein